jgi:hypothetical protein
MADRIPYAWRLRWERLLLTLSEGWLRLPPHGFTIRYQEAEILRLQQCTDLLAEALFKHERWCGLREDADPVYFQAIEEYQRAVARRPG